MNPSFSDLERAAAALSRGLSASLQWPELMVAARDLASQFSDTAQPSELPVEDCPAAVAAARVLDGAAQFAPQLGPAQSRELGLWAAAAFAQTGNFPSSTVAVRRTFVRLRGHDAETSALLCAVAPVLASSLRADSVVAAHLDRFLASGEEEDAHRAQKAWDEMVSNASGKYPRALWDLASRGLRAAFSLSTLRVLAISGATFPAGFTSQLSARVPVLLPPQARALRDGFLSDKGNALAALSPGTGKTLLGELFLAASLGSGDFRSPENPARWAVFVVPYVALGRGVAAAVKAHFPPDVQIHGWLGRATPDDNADFSSGMHLVIATPERLDAHLRRHSAHWETLRGVVCDEAHLIGDGARGARRVARRAFDTAQARARRWGALAVAFRRAGRFD